MTEALSKSDVEGKTFAKDIEVKVTYID